VGAALTYPLTVTKAGTGSGSITSSPAGIDCGSTCSFGFNAGTGVTLTATADAGSTFVGWSGEGCTGTGTCTVNMTQTRKVTATFMLSGVPGTAVLISPTGTITTATPTYTWQAVSTSTWYYLWVMDSTGVKLSQWYTAAEASCGSGTGTCRVTPSKDLAPGAATWYIQTYNPVGTGPWSSGLSFTVTSP
jgi:hypothetical protein